LSGKVAVGLASHWPRVAGKALAQVSDYRRQASDWKRSDRRYLKLEGYDDWLIYQ